MMMEKHLRPCRCNPCDVEPDEFLEVPLSEYLCVHHRTRGIDRCIGHLGALEEGLQKDATCVIMGSNE